MRVCVCVRARVCQRVCARAGGWGGGRRDIPGGGALGTPRERARSPHRAAGPPLSIPPSLPPSLAVLPAPPAGTAEDELPAERQRAGALCARTARSGRFVCPRSPGAGSVCPHSPGKGSIRRAVPPPPWKSRDISWPSSALPARAPSADVFRFPNKTRSARSFARVFPPGCVFLRGRGAAGFPLIGCALRQTALPPSPRVEAQPRLPLPACARVCSSGYGLLCVSGFTVQVFGFCSFCACLTPVLIL